MKRKGIKISIILQVSILFLIGAIAAGVITRLTQSVYNNENVKTQMESLADKISDEVRLSVYEYPAHSWLLRFWYEHADLLDIDYDETFAEGTRTGEKYRTLLQRQPDLMLKYADTQTLEALPFEDQVLCAEITYSWLITRLNQIKRAYQIDFLFCVVTDETFMTQTFLLSAADEGSIRGTAYEEVYPLGVRVSLENSQSQQDAMRYALQNSSHLADAGNYVDYYAYLDRIDDLAVLIGMTYNQADIKLQVQTQTASGTAISIFYLLLLSMICLVLLYWFILTPLKTIQQNIRLYKDTKDSDTAIKNLSQIRSNNEMGTLCTDITGLIEEIDDYLFRIRTITAERERIGAELELASRIQTNMVPNIFPPFPEHLEFDIFASMKPAREVGGDFYDFFKVDDNHLAMVIADVSGKGVPAAMFMTVSMTMIHNTAMGKFTPSRILRIVNELTCKNNKEEMFVSVWLGILELDTGKITAANAGHEYPICKTPDGRFELLKDPHGFVVGGFPDTEYKDYELQLKPGSKLFLYTDGLPEASDIGQNLFGMERTVQALRRAEDLTPVEILNAVNEEVSEFVGDAEQFDDLTMLCLHYHGPR